MAEVRVWTDNPLRLVRPEMEMVSTLPSSLNMHMV